MILNNISKETTYTLAIVIFFVFLISFTVIKLSNNKLIQFSASFIAILTLSTALSVVMASPTPLLLMFGFFSIVCLLAIIRGVTLIGVGEMLSRWQTWISLIPIFIFILILLLWKK